MAGPGFVEKDEERRIIICASVICVYEDHDAATWK